MLSATKAMAEQWWNVVVVGCACNLWGGDACPRKTRPPRIGDIPRYTAVDEESPGVAAGRLSSSSACLETRENDAMLELRLTTHGDVFATKTSPVGKSPGNEVEEEEEEEAKDSRGKNRRTRLTGINGSATSSSSSRRSRDIGTGGKDTGIPRVKVIDEAKRRSEVDSSAKREKDRVGLVRIGSTPSEEEIRELRKDSALYLEEVEGLEKLRDTLQRSRSPKRSTPRRESSGYASNLGTFDEDGRSNESDILAIRERRRSSTKKLVTLEPFQGRRSTRNEDNSELRGREDSTPRSNDSIGGVESTSGTDISDIREVKEESSSRASSKSSARDERGSRTLTRSVSSEETRGAIVAKDNPGSSRRRLVRSPSEHLSYAEVLAKSGSRGKVEARQDGDGNPRGTGSVDNRVARRKRIVHQYSTPNFSSVELESILEKPTEKSFEDHRKFTRGTERSRIPEKPSDKIESSFPPERVLVTEIPSKETRTRRTGETSRVTGASKGSRVSDSKSEESESSRLTEETEIPANTKSLLPKSVKVYQLLSTQSEDRGDGVPNLADRRTSLQITRQQDDRVSVDVTKSTKESLDVVLPLQPDTVPTLSVSGAECTSTSLHLTPTTNVVGPPVRKLSTPAEMGSSQRLLAESNISIRPIYPYCPYSPYGSPQGSPRTRRRPLRESRRVSIDNRQGALQLNQYKLLDNIGQGSYGIVKLAYNEEDETHYAMKILSKKKLMKKAGIFGRMAPGRKGNANPLAKVYREIALLKKLDHPNVVKLVEVLDDPDEDNLYLAFELVQRGEVLQLPADQPLPEDVARIHFRDIVLGVEYLHYQRIVHRDIKPSNLLVDSEGRVKVADLGVSAELRAAGELLSGPAGTPAFAAPETTTPGAEYSGTLCDVWSMGVTLFSLVIGRVPWDGAGSIIGVQAAVRSEPLKFPEKANISESLRDVITRMLEKDPTSRISLAEIKIHPWVTKDGTEVLPSETDNCRLPVTVTDEEVARVVTRVPKLDTLILIKTMLKQHSFQNPFLPKRSAKSICGDTPPSEESLTMSITESVSSEKSKGRAEKFQQSGRSNSAPDTYDCHFNDRQVSVESPLPSVTEALAQENDSSERSYSSDLECNLERT